jgi:hypothetical protein
LKYLLVNEHNALPSQRRETIQEGYDCIEAPSKCVRLVKDVREEWKLFSEFTGIRKEIHPVWDESREGRTQDWSGEKCSVPYGLIESVLQPALKKYKCVIINVWEGATSPP